MTQDREDRAFPARSRLTGLHVITAEGLIPHRTHADVARAAAVAGASVVQFREKRAAVRAQLRTALEIRAALSGKPCLFLVNDRVDIALAAGSDGVHVGDEDLPPEVARELLGPNQVIGVSVANELEAREAERAGADYVGVGPIYATPSKADAGPAVGVQQIGRIRRVTRLPIIAIGGIGVEQVPEVRHAGADGFAVIGAVAGAPDMVAAVRSLVAAWRDG